MVQPAPGPPHPAPVPAEHRDDTTRAVWLNWRKTGPGADGVFKMRFRHMHFIGRDFDVDFDFSAGDMQTFYNFLQVTRRAHDAVRINLNALGQGFNPAVIEPGVFGTINSWRASSIATDISGPHHNLSQHADQRVGMLRLALRLWQRLHQVNATTLPPLPQAGMNPRKKSLVKLGIFLSFLPVELADKPFISIYGTLVQIRAGEI